LEQVKKLYLWSVVAKARRGVCEQDTLNPQLGVAIISRIACGTPNVSKKKAVFYKLALLKGLSQYNLYRSKAHSEGF
jgi:hypothetical protein